MPDSGTGHPNAASEDFDWLDRVDRLCDTYEQEWLAGNRPRVDDFLRQVPDEQRDKLRQELEVIQRDYEARAQMTNPTQVEPIDSEPASTSLHQIRIAANLTIAERYTLQEKIGVGGMGEVWAAKQIHPVKRKVALKLVKSGLDSRTVLARFDQERQALALMDHPNIARVLDAGMMPTGQPFFVMELVDGMPVGKFCDKMKLSLRERLELFIPICQAVQHAHQKGLVHRDLKPANILVTMIDNRPVPKVIDFGLAKAFGGAPDEETMTQFGAVVGTLDYMSPEQAGFSEDVDTRSDIYSLGVVLYELLTGLRPIERARLKSADVTEMIRVIREDEPSRPSARLTNHDSLTTLAAARNAEPRKMMSQLRGDLDLVVMKCLAKERERRYETANGLARDLQRYLADEPVEARPPSAGYRLRKFVRRHKGRVVAATLILFALLSGMAGVFWQWREAESARKNELAQRTEAENARDEAEDQQARAESGEARAKAEEQHARDEAAKARKATEETAAALYSSNILRAQLKFRANNVVDAEAILDDCEVARRGWEWHHLKHLCHADIVTLSGHTNWVYSVAYSPDGKLLASAGGGNPFWETKGAAGDVPPGEIILWNAETGTRLRTLRGHKNVIKDLSFSPDGKTLVSASQDDTVRLWEAASGKPLQVLPGGSGARRHVVGFGATSVAYSPDGKRLAVGLLGKVAVWNLTHQSDRRWVLEFSIPLPELQVPGVVFSPDGMRLAVATPGGTNDGQIHIWDLAGQKEKSVVKVDAGIVNGVTFSPDGGSLLAWGDANSRGIMIWDTETGNLSRTLSAQNTDFLCGSFSPAGDLFAAGSGDGVVRIWSAISWREIRVFRGHRDSVLSLSFAPEGRCLASASADRTVKIWDVQQDPEHGEVNARGVVTIQTIAFADRGNRLVVALRGGQLYDFAHNTDVSWQTNSSIGLFGQWMSPGETACFDAKGRLLAGISNLDGKVAKCWDFETGRELATVNGHRQELRYVTINTLGTHIATAGRRAPDELPPMEVKVWEINKNRPVLELAEPNFLVHRLALNPTGDRLAVSGNTDRHGNDGQSRKVSVLRVYDVKTGRVTRSFTVPSPKGAPCDKLGALAFSADGEHLAAAGNARTVVLWDLRSQQRPVVCHKGPIGAMDLTFSPDGRRLAVASRLQVKLLNAETGNEVLTLLGRKHLSPDKNGFNPRVRFSPDGKQLVAICNDRVGVLALWSAGTANRDPSSRVKVAKNRAITHYLQLARRTLSSGSQVKLDTTYRQLQQMVKERAPTPTILYQWGGIQARYGRWDEAAVTFDKYFTIGKGRHFSFCEITPISLYRNDLKAYRKQSKFLLERYGQSKNPQILLDILFWGLLISDNGGPPKELQRMADRCVDGTEKFPSYRWMVMTKGMAEFRAGRFDSAVKWLRKADPLLPEFPAGVNFYLSMAYHRLNEPGKAKAAYEKAMNQFKGEFGSADKFTPGKGDWRYWPLLQVLRREAEATLKTGKRSKTKKD